MTACAACYVVVSPDCPHCQRMYREAVHYVKALERVGVVFVNVEDLDDSLAMQLVDYDAPEPGAVLMARMVTPQFVCIIRDEGGVERVVYRKPIHDLSTLYNFLVNTARHLWRLYKNCYEPKRGRKPKQKKEEKPAAEAALGATPVEEKPKRGRRKKKSGEGEA
ncbi:MAG: hypothetical protein ACP5H5_03745 [Pyrobaculum sp.]